MHEANFEFIRYESSGGAASLTMTRPPVNVINIPMLQELEHALLTAGQDEQLRVLQLRAAGKLFSAGVDVADHTPDRVQEMITLFDRVCLALADFPAPTVAVVQGHALGGGCELVMCCDMAWMAEGATIGQPEVKLGLLAPIAALRLPGLVGPRWAAQILFSGEPLDAARAEAVGLVNGSVPAENLEETVARIVAQLVPLSAAALRMNKRSYLMGMTNWQAGLKEMEELYLEELMELEDANEGLQAFIEKRDPVWRNR
jgi:cyclohexa-1,5-dienecarbonyl-CoA hydratase